MLKKLIKHDLKYGVRMFAVLHIILIIGCLMARFLVIDHLDFSADPEEFAPVIALLIVVLTMLFSAISFGCCIMYAVRFYKNLFTDEGYITWTLPASPLTQLWAKILSASIWYVLDLTICFAAAWFLISGDNIQSALERIKPDFQAALGMSFSSFCGLVVFFSFVGILSCVLFIYTSIAIGQLVPAHRIIVSIAVYFILNLITQIISIGVSIITSVFPDYVFFSCTDQLFRVFLSDAPDRNLYYDSTCHCRILYYLSDFAKKSEFDLKEGIEAHPPGCRSIPFTDLFSI